MIWCSKQICFPFVGANVFWMIPKELGVRSAIECLEFKERYRRTSNVFKISCAVIVFFLRSRA